MANHVLPYLFQDTEHFEPSDTRIARLEDTPARTTVLMHVRNFVMEVDVNYIAATPGKPTRCSVSPPRVFRIDRSNQKAEILVSCPER